MTQTNFYGRLAARDVAIVRRILQTWLGVDELAEKAKLSGDQLVYKDEAVYVYASAAVTGSQFLLEGHRRAPLREVELWLQRLLASCRALDVDAALEYVAVDDDGQEISEQYRVSPAAPSEG
jgi:hypothetical protein